MSPTLVALCINACDEESIMMSQSFYSAPRLVVGILNVMGVVQSIRKLIVSDCVHAVRIDFETRFHSERDEVLSWPAESSAAFQQHRYQVPSSKRQVVMLLEDRQYKTRLYVRVET